EEKLRKVRQTLDDEVEKLESYRSGIDEIKNAAQRKGGEQASVEAQLSEEVRMELESRTSEEWKRRSEAIIQQIEREKADFRLLATQRDRMSQEPTQLKSDWEKTRTYREREAGQYKEAEMMLLQALEESSFESIQSVREILRLNIDV